MNLERGFMGKNDGWVIDKSTYTIKNDSLKKKYSVDDEENIDEVYNAFDFNSLFFKNIKSCDISLFVGIKNIVYIDLHDIMYNYFLDNGIDAEMFCGNDEQTVFILKNINVVVLVEGYEEDLYIKVCDLNSDTITERTGSYRSDDIRALLRSCIKKPKVGKERIKVPIRKPDYHNCVQKIKDFHNSVKLYSSKALHEVKGENNYVHMCFNDLDIALGLIEEGNDEYKLCLLVTRDRGQEVLLEKVQAYLNTEDLNFPTIVDRLLHHLNEHEDFSTCKQAIEKYQ